MENSNLDKINEIRKQADIVEVISRYIQVNKKGRNYFAVCPFHNDTNPSLSISSDKQIFKCFVCNEAGNVFSFVSKYRKIPYNQAIKEVADIVGIEYQVQNQNNSEVVDLKLKVLYDILNDTVLFYKNCLVSNQQAYKYCINRQLTSSIIEAFNIGYSIDQHRLITYLLNKGYTKEDIFRSGIAIENNGELNDRFAQRLVFPICDINGKVIGFSGRIIQKSDMAKYVNSPESEIFIKGNTFYNYSFALPYIKKEKKIYICEGFMDCIALYKVGIYNAVALMGTAFTKEHLRILKFLGVEVILALDGDNPGNINANKLANTLFELNLNVKVIPHYNDVKDLDEFLNKYDQMTLINHLNSVAINAFDFNFYIATKLDYLKNNEDKKSFLKTMCKYIAQLSDIDIDIYVNKLHNELGFSTSTIVSLIHSYKPNESIKISEEVKMYNSLKKYQDLQIRILSQMMNSQEAIEIFIENIVFLEDEEYRKIAFLISEYYKENKEQFDKENLVADLFTKISTEFSDNNDLIKALTLIDENKNKYPLYNKESFNNMLYELKEIVPLEKELKKVSEEIKFADTLAKKNDCIRHSIALKSLIAQKKSTKNGGN